MKVLRLYYFVCVVYVSRYSFALKRIGLSICTYLRLISERKKIFHEVDCFPFFFVCQPSANRLNRAILYYTFEKMSVSFREFVCIMSQFKIWISREHILDYSFVQFLMIMLTNCLSIVRRIRIGPKCLRVNLHCSVRFKNTWFLDF